MRPRRRFPRLPASEARTVVNRPIPPPPPPLEPGPPLPPPWYYEPWAWLLLVLVLLAIGGGLAAYFLTRGGGHKVVLVQVPRVVGLQEAPAVTKLIAAGLRPRVTRAPTSRPAGIVFSQSPAAGTAVRRGSLVSIAASTGPAAVTVPNLNSLTEAQAVAQLTRLGLRASVVQVPSTRKAGTVIAQNPAAEGKVKPGSSVRLNVSKGTTPVKTVTATTSTAPPTTTTTTTTAQAPVPDVVGQSLSNAMVSMKAAGLLGDSYPVNSTQPGGTVVAENPAAGTTLGAGSVVRLNVSVGTTRPALPVPNVSNGRYDEIAARMVLAKAFTVRAIYRHATSAAQRGLVLDQSPAAGAKIQRWAQVTIFVGR